MNNREIKFRVWDNKYKLYLDLSKKEYCFIQQEKFMLFGIGGWELPDINITIEQYIGIKDINGKEVYENDIVDYFDWCYASIMQNHFNLSKEDQKKIWHSDKKIENDFENAYGDKWKEIYYPLRGVVKWNNEYLSYEPLIFSQDDYNGNCFANVCNGKDSENHPKSYFEVVGNVHKNKDLLKNGE